MLYWTVDDDIECLEARLKDILARFKKLLDIHHSMARYLIDPHTDYIMDSQFLSNQLSTPGWLLGISYDILCCSCDRMVGNVSSGSNMLSHISINDQSYPIEWLLGAHSHIRHGRMASRSIPNPFHPF